jgi:hypothetical protein
MFERGEGLGNFWEGRRESDEFRDRGHPPKWRHWFARVHAPSLLGVVGLHYAGHCACGSAGHCACGSAGAGLEMTRQVRTMTAMARLLYRLLHRLLQEARLRAGGEALGGAAAEGAPRRLEAPRGG